jgi:hypothetical protein
LIFTRDIGSLREEEPQMSHVARTNRAGLMMSVHQGRPEVIGAWSNQRD